MSWTKGETDTVNEIHRAVIEIATELPVIREEVADHRLMLNGPPENGKRPGLRRRVDSLEASRRSYRFGIRSLWFLVSSLIVAAVTAIWTMN